MSHMCCMYYMFYIVIYVLNMNTAHDRSGLLVFIVTIIYLNMVDKVFVEWDSVRG